jgi:hypothetical protein
MTAHVLDYLARPPGGPSHRASGPGLSDWPAMLPAGTWI